MTFIAFMSVEIWSWERLPQSETEQQTEDEQQKATKKNLPALFGIYRQVVDEISYIRSYGH